MERAAGILLAVSSLPSPYGIGSFGEAARNWIRFLKEAGQKYWQILPLGPTGWGDSPYQSFSAFAISPYYIDLDILIQQGLLLQEELAGIRWGAPGRTGYAVLYRRREPLLRRAFSRFKPSPPFEDFCRTHARWLADYALFMALKKKMKGASWLDWDESIRFREKKVLERQRKKFAADILYHSFVQYLAYTQWAAVKSFAKDCGISVIGDMPIYVAMDSADTWSNSELFQLDENRKPLRVAGCPPDPFAAGGQLWGNPLYRWDVNEKENFAWWLDRLRVSFSLYDAVRIDHFRAFESYFSIPAGAPDARFGEWVKGPGLAFINAVNAEFSGARIIAEDLGFLTAEVRSLLAASGYPGMKVLQFAFDSREASDYMPYTYRRNCAAYTGTHDNSTVLGWFKSADPADVKLAIDYLGISGNGPGEKCWAFIRAVLSSVADLAIVPMQDYLCLDDRARMNTPSTLGGNNWCWRMLPLVSQAELAGKIRRLTEVTGR